MGCGCGKNNVRNAGKRPIVSPRRSTAVNSGQAAGPAPIQLQALSRTPNRSPSGLTKERRLTERRRRAAIAKRVLG